jgi:hypothetical protein
MSQNFSQASQSLTTVYDFDTSGPQFCAIGLQAREICEWAIFCLNRLAISPNVGSTRGPLLRGAHLLGWLNGI